MAESTSVEMLKTHDAFWDATPTPTLLIWRCPRNMLASLVACHIFHWWIVLGSINQIAASGAIFNSNHRPFYFPRFVDDETILYRLRSISVASDTTPLIDIDWHRLCNMFFSTSLQLQLPCSGPLPWVAPSSWSSHPPQPWKLGLHGASMEQGQRYEKS